MSKKKSDGIGNLPEFTDEMELALHKLACEADDYDTGRAPAMYNQVSGGYCGTSFRFVAEALAELRRTGWRPDMLGAARWNKAS